MPGTQKVGSSVGSGSTLNASQYVAHQGDTLDYVAKRYKVSVASLRAANTDLAALAKEGDRDELPFGIVLKLPLAKDRFADPANPEKVKGVSAKEPGADPTSDLPVYRRTNPWSPNANWTQTASNFGGAGQNDPSRSTSGGSSGGTAAAAGVNQSKVAVSGDVKSWIDQACAILEQNGVDASKLDKNGIAAIIQFESSGNPNAINLSDSNAVAGHPSKGLMQCIDGTFAEHALPGHNSIYNPVDNIIAGVRYALSRYGSISNVPGIRAVNSGGSYVGY